ncbi:unnamed protein product [Candidula unifasciata]|uniref:Uncharacterized protein n=1 Tax=Candidula unifasciata TaxID=100452 RepID=A0A8S3ZMX4_9EUPU|nr:unnamed protein product [Candidula unifasciata]
MTPLDEIMSQSEVITSSILKEETQLFQPTSTTSVIQVTRWENVDITPQLRVSDITTVNTTPLLQPSGLEVATSANHENSLSQGQQQELISSTTSDHSHTPEISQRSPTLTSNVESSVLYTRPDTQMPANSASSEASSTSGSYASAHTPSTAAHSNSILSTTNISSQIPSSITSTFTVIPTSDIKIIPALNSLTNASEDLNQQKQSHEISTSEPPPLTSSSTFALRTTLPVTHLALSTSNPPTVTSALNNAPTTITPCPIATTLELSTTDSLTQTRTPQLPTWSASRTESLSSIRGSEFVNEEVYTGITSVTGNTAVPVITWAVPDMTMAVPDTTQIAPSPTQTVCDSKQALSDDSNGTDSNSHSKGDSRKPAAKPDNRLPTFSSSTDMKLRAIIITVSTTLLALIIGLFIAIIIIKYRKKHKHVSFDDKTTNITDVQTETSDTVFIISHMEGGHNLNSDTAWDGKTSTSSPKDTSKVENGSKLTKKSLKFSRQSVSAVISKTKFDCIKGQTEDDSELLMYSWT